MQRSFSATYLESLKKDLPLMLGVSTIIGTILCLSYFFNSDDNWERVLLLSLHGALISFVLWIGNGFIVDYLNFKYSWLADGKKRISLGIIGSLVYTIIAYELLQIGLMKWFYGIAYTETIAEVSVRNLLLPVTLTALITLTAHLVAFFNQWRKAELEKEKLKREHLASQFEVLKSQVNPHFLFNSLNALTVLVHKDQDLAVQFIQQLSKVYRYVLETQNKEIISLETETIALKSYVFLLKIRFGENLNINIDLKNQQKIKIVPLALQMLVENAIKHNIVSKSKHLNVDIFQENKTIVVKNNLQIKSNAAEPSGIGLANIKARYQYLAQKEVEITNSGDEFIVRLPFILND